MSKRVLITGGAGFIGSHLVEECQRRGWKVAVIDKAGADGRPNPLAHEVKGDWRHIVADVANYRDLESAYSAAQKPCEGSEWTAGHPDKYQATVGFDYIFHLAAEPYVPKSFDEPALFLDVNVRGTLNVLNLAKRVKADRVLVVSSSEVYGGVPYGTTLTGLKIEKLSRTAKG
jgi:nucleoside-diphosphate-sugar epimerase